MLTKESLQKIFKKILIDYNFQLPVSWVWIGVNGAFMTGRIEFSEASKEFKSILLSGKPRKLRFPVNVMFVDARGEAAHVLFKGTGGADEVNHCRFEEPPGPISNWPKA